MFRPTPHEIEQVRDFADMWGKSQEELIDSIKDAQAGAFERLKDFGVFARKRGKVIQFHFRGIETHVEFNDVSIKEYVFGLIENFK